MSLQIRAKLDLDRPLKGASGPLILVPRLTEYPLNRQREAKTFAV